jgi:anti-anti-sigma factor
MIELTHHVAGPCTVVQCRGRLDMVAVPTMKTLIESLVNEGKPRIVIDLSGTAFIDSSGLGALIGGLKRTRQAGGDLRIAAPTEQITTVLGLTNLDRVLTPHHRIEDALGAW